jgi:1-acyl-sn-glycerol-3-phosphate acyltransferase
VQIALQLFCKKIFIQNNHLLQVKGPAIIVANHPNSFFDAIVICSVFKQPIFSLARGDAFKKSIPNFLLRKLLMLPIFRISEGKENLHLNNQTFQACQQILANNGMILIFIEGICKQQYQLQPFKKGAARIAFDALQTNDIKPLQIITAALQYSSFKQFGMQVHIGLNSFVAQYSLQQNFNAFTLEFNRQAQELLQQQLISSTQALATQSILQTATTYIGKISEENLLIIHNSLINKQNKRIGVLKTIGWPFYIIGFALHAPLYYVVKNIAIKLTQKTVFYHSVLFGMLLLLYPLYVIGLITISNTLINSYNWWHLLWCCPLLAFATVRFKWQ